MLRTCHLIPYKCVTPQVPFPHIRLQLDMRVLFLLVFIGFAKTRSLALVFCFGFLRIVEKTTNLHRAIGWAGFWTTRANALVAQTTGPTRSRDADY